MGSHDALQTGAQHQSHYLTFDCNFSSAHLVMSFELSCFHVSCLVSNFGVLCRKTILLKQPCVVVVYRWFCLDSTSLTSVFATSCNIGGVSDGSLDFPPYL